MPVRACRWLRRMRGGAQAHLVEADNGGFYVVKAKNNPQHRRILINEWISSVFLKYLQVETPDPEIVEFSAAFLQSNPECAIQFGSRTVPVEPGWHFGSRYPGDPAKVAVFDVLPDVLLGKVANARDFAGAFAFDKWVANADARQAVFYRAILRADRTEEGPRPGFLAVMIDAGYAFDGPNWAFSDSPMQGLFHRRQVYDFVREFEDFEPWLSRIENFPEEVADRALRQIPREWTIGDEARLEGLMEELLRRRGRVRHLIEDVTLASHLTAFANWRRGAGASAGE